MNAWACQPFLGPTTYHDTEAAAESLARSLVGSCAGAAGVRECVVYRVEVRGESA